VLFGPTVSGNIYLEEKGEGHVRQEKVSGCG